MGEFPLWPGDGLRREVYALPLPSTLRPHRADNSTGPSDFSTFKGNAGNVWAKDRRVAYRADQTPPWDSGKLASQGASWTVNIPKLLSNGKSLLRKPHQRRPA